MVHVPALVGFRRERNHRSEDRARVSSSGRGATGTFRDRWELVPAFGAPAAVPAGDRAVPVEGSVEQRTEAVVGLHSPPHLRAIRRHASRSSHVGHALIRRAARAASSSERRACAAADSRYDATSSSADTTSAATPVTQKNTLTTRLAAATRRPTERRHRTVQVRHATSGHAKGTRTLRTGRRAGHERPGRERRRSSRGLPVRIGRREHQQRNEDVDGDHAAARRAR